MDEEITNSNKQIQIISWNANSLGAHPTQLKQYLDNTTIKPVAICIQETKMKATSKLSIPGYKREDKCRTNRQGGGVSTFIRNDVNHERLPNIPHEIEGVTIQIKSTTRDIIITNLYIPPNERIDIEIYKPIFNGNNKIICGDLNAASTLWGASKTNPRGKQLEEIIDDLGLTVLNTGEGTFLKNDGTYTHTATLMSASPAATSPSNVNGRSCRRTTGAATICQHRSPSLSNQSVKRTKNRNST